MARGERDFEREDRGRVRNWLTRHGRQAGPNEIDFVLRQLDRGEVPDPERLRPAEETPWYQRAVDAAWAVPAGAYQGAGALLDVVGASGPADYFRDQAERVREYQSPAQQASIQALGEAEGVGGIIGTGLVNPGAVVDMALTSVAPMVAAPGVGGLAARAVGRSLGPVARAAVGEGGVTATQTAGDLLSAGVNRGEAMTTGLIAGGFGAGVGAAGGQLAGRLTGGGAGVEEILAGRLTKAGRRFPLARGTRQWAAAPLEIGEEFIQEGGQEAVTAPALGEDVSVARIVDAGTRGMLASAPISAAVSARGTPPTPAAPAGEVQVVDPPDVTPAPDAPAALKPINLDAWRSASKTTSTKVTMEQVDSAIRSVRDKHRRRAVELAEAQTEGQYQAEIDDLIFRGNRGDRMAQAIHAPSTRLIQEVGRINEQQDVSSYHKMREIVRAVSIEVTANDVASRLEDAGNIEGARLVRTATPETLNQTWRDADHQRSPDTDARTEPQVRRELNPHYQADYLYDQMVEKAGSPDAQLYNRLSEQSNADFEAAGNIGHIGYIEVGGGTKNAPVGAPLRAVTVDKLQNLRDNRPRLVESLLKEGGQERLHEYAENQARADLPAQVRAGKRISDIENLNLEPGNRAQRAWRGFWTTFGQKGYYARAIGDEAVRKGEAAERPTALLDLTVNSQVTSRRLFGDAVQKAAEQGVSADLMGQLVLPDGSLNQDSALHDVRTRVEEGVLTAAREMQAAHVIGRTKKIETFDQAHAAIQEATGNYQGGLVGLTSSATQAAELARQNQGRINLTQFMLNRGEATEVAESADDTIDVSYDGEVKHFKTDKYVAAITKETEAFDLPLLKPITAVFRFMALNMNLGWQLANIPIDQFRTYVNDPNIRAIRDLPRFLAELADVREWREAYLATRDPLRRAMDERTAGARTRAQLQNIRELEESGFLPSESRAEFVRDPTGTAKAPPVDISQYLEGGKSTLTGLEKWANLVRRPSEIVMATVDARTRLAAARRVRARTGQAPTTADALMAREALGSPPTADTFRALSGVPGAFLQFYNAIIAGMVADARVLKNPDTRGGAMLKLGLSTVAPAMLAMAVKNGMFGEPEDDEGWWGDYYRGLQGLPDYVMGQGANVPLPGVTHVNLDGQQENYVFNLPFNRTFAPFFTAMAATMSRADVGEDAWRAARDGLLQAIAESAPGAAAGVNVAKDTAEMLFGEGNPADRWGRPLFTPTEMADLPSGDKALKFALLHLPKHVGLGSAGGAILRAVGKEGLAGIQAEAEREGGWVEDLGEVPELGRHLRRFVHTRERGRRDRRRAVAELEVRRGKEGDVERTYRRDEAIKQMVAEYPQADAHVIRRHALRLAQGEGDQEQEAARATDYAKRALLAYPEGQQWSDLLWQQKDPGTAMIRAQSEGARPSIRRWLQLALDSGAISADTYQDWEQAAR